jgi:hypothetical protein
MKFDNMDYTIGSHFASALINGDYSGLEDHEEAALNAWIDAHEERGSHWDCNDDNPEFCTDEVSGLKAECVLVRQYFPARG